MKADGLEILERIPDGSPAARGVAGGIAFAIPLSGILDLEAERRRLGREIDKARAERTPHARKLENADFLGKAPRPVVEKTRGIVRGLDERIGRLEETMALLGDA